MKFVENILESLDTYFAPKKESEKYIIILGLGAVIGYLGYLLFFDSAKSKHVRSEQTKSKLEKSIKENNDYLRSITLNEDRDYYDNLWNKHIQRGRINPDNPKEPSTPFTGVVENNNESLSSFVGIQSYMRHTPFGYRGCYRYREPSGKATGAQYMLSMRFERK